MARIKKFGQYPRKNFGEELTEHTGVIHDYLGIDLDFLINEKLGVSMIKYLHKMLTDFSE